MSSKKKTKALTLTVANRRPFGFACRVEGGSLTQPYIFEAAVKLKETSISFFGVTEADIAGTYAQGHIPNQLIEGCAPSWHRQEDKEYKIKGQEYIAFKITDDLLPMFRAISTYELDKEEHDTLLKYWFRDYPDIDIDDPRIRPYEHIDPAAAGFFGQILSRILEGEGYSVTISALDYYFPAPTATELVAPVFALGLQKDLQPIDIDDGYETTITYLSIKTPKRKTDLQLKLFNAPEYRLQEYQRLFQKALTPYGLKCLYLVIEECGQNRRNPFFTLDVNRCLDLLGHKRTKKGPHHSKNRRRLLTELEDLTKIQFNIERREPKRSSKGKETAIRFRAPLLSITQEFAEYEVDEGQPIETGVKIKDNVQIFLHPQIYKDIHQGWYTVIPKEYLTIDARRHPHAILVYPFIANQWRIGLHQHRGEIKTSMERLLKNSGLLDGLPRRKNQQQAFVDNVIKNLRWLKSQPGFWIGDVRTQAKGYRWEDTAVTITMDDGHPLKRQMLTGPKQK